MAAADKTNRHSLFRRSPVCYINGCAWIPAEEGMTVTIVLVRPAYSYGAISVERVFGRIPGQQPHPPMLAQSPWTLCQPNAMGY